MRVERNAEVALDGLADLHGKRIGTFCPANLTRKHVRPWAVLQDRAEVSDIPGKDGDRFAWELEVDGLGILDLVSLNHKVDAVAAGDEMLLEFDGGEVLAPDGGRLQQRDGSSDLGANRHAARDATDLGAFVLDIGPDPVGKAEEGGNDRRIIEWAQPLPVLRRHALPGHRQFGRNALELRQLPIIELHPVPGDILQEARKLRRLR